MTAVIFPRKGVSSLAKDIYSRSFIPFAQMEEFGRDPLRHYPGRWGADL